MTPGERREAAMKVLIVSVALLMLGVVFIVPPLIAVLPVLLVGLFLIASPMIIASMTRNTDHGRSRDQRPTSVSRS
jgi:hypothetical protein